MEGGVRFIVRVIAELAAAHFDAVEISDKVGIGADEKRAGPGERGNLKRLAEKDILMRVIFFA